jgi:hypothetical protein
MSLIKKTLIYCLDVLRIERDTGIYQTTMELAQKEAPIESVNNDNNVSSNQEGTDIRLGYDTPSLLFGDAAVTTTANVFQANGLGSAILSPVTLNACVAVDEFGNCSTFVPLTIQATWTGFGTPSIDNFGYKAGCPLPILERPSPSSQTPTCGVAVLQFSGTNWQATATGTLGGQNLGNSAK